MNTDPLETLDRKNHFINSRSNYLSTNLNYPKCRHSLNNLNKDEEYKLYKSHYNYDDYLRICVYWLC